MRQINADVLIYNDLHGCVRHQDFVISPCFVTQVVTGLRGTKGRSWKAATPVTSPGGFEPSTCRLGGGCSIQLSYEDLSPYCTPEQSRCASLAPLGIYICYEVCSLNAVALPPSVTL